MSVWLNETEYRESDAASIGLAVNVAFLQEIKEDNVEFRELVDQCRTHFAAVNGSERNHPVESARLLGLLRDEMKTYFALEEFFGYIENAEMKNPKLSREASGLTGEHEELFVELNSIVNSVEEVVYRECNADTAFDDAVEAFQWFMKKLQRHEDREMELMMRLHNEEIGVGD